MPVQRQRLKSEERLHGSFKRNGSYFTALRFNPLTCVSHVSMLIACQ